MGIQIRVGMEYNVFELSCYRILVNKHTYDYAQQANEIQGMPLLLDSLYKSYNHLNIIPAYTYKNANLFDLHVSIPALFCHNTFIPP